MPRFSYSNLNLGLPPVGVYVAQVVAAKKTISKSSGNEMIVLSLRTIPDGYRLKYFLVFNGKNDELICQFGRHCEGELSFPTDFKGDFSLTAGDTLNRIVYADVVHEAPEGDDQPRAKIKFGGILSRAQALARDEALGSIKLPANVPPPKQLATLPAEENGSTSRLLDDDSIPF
jgi:hypothetical protein